MTDRSYNDDADFETTHSASYMRGLAGADDVAIARECRRIERTQRSRVPSIVRTGSTSSADQPVTFWTIIGAEGDHWGHIGEAYGRERRWLFVAFLTLLIVFICFGL